MGDNRDVTIEHAVEELTLVLHDIPAGSRLAVVVDDLQGGLLELDSGGKDEPWRAASVIKVPVMTAALEAVAAGRLSLDTRIPLAGAERVDPSGVLCILADVTEVSVRDLITLMIAISDNMATNMLIDAVGMDAVNASMAAAGMVGSVLRRPLNTRRPEFAEVRNSLTPTDAVRALARIARGEGCYADPQLREVALTALQRQQHVDLLPRHLPPHLSLAHKTGSLDGLRHDAGIVLRDSHALGVVAVFTDGFGPSCPDLPPAGAESSGLRPRVECSDEERSAEDLVATIGGVIWQTWN